MATRLPEVVKIDCRHCGETFESPLRRSPGSYPAYCGDECRAAGERWHQKRRRNSGRKRPYQYAVIRSARLSSERGIPEASFKAPFFKKGAC